MQTYPYDDANMKFDNLTKRYVLTEQCLISMGIDLRGRLAGRKAITPDLLINQVLETVTDQIYAFIHSHSADNARQDYIIAKIPSARMIIYQALKKQVVYLLNVGDLTNSAKEEEQRNAINVVARQILNTTIHEIGCSILYAGV